MSDLSASGSIERSSLSSSNQVEAIFERATSPRQFAEFYSQYLCQLLGRLDLVAVDQFIRVLWDARERGSKIYFIGNGGSAATASHFANDLSVGTRAKYKPFKAISLTDNNAIMTAIGNDFGYEYLFQKQLEPVLENGDVLVAISASGNSPNLLTAIEYARAKGNLTVALVGFDGGKLKDLCDVVVQITTHKGEYGPVEDLHMILDHLVSNYFTLLLRKENTHRSADGAGLVYPCNLT